MKNEENPPMKTVEDILRFLKNEASKFAPGETKCQLKDAIEFIENSVKSGSENDHLKNSDLSTQKKSSEKI